MALAPFFERIYGSVGGHLSISRAALSASLENSTVGVYCGPSPSVSDKWIAEFTTNLVARLYPRIAFQGPDDCVSALKNLAAQINPQIEFAPEAPGKTTVAIGALDSEGAIFPAATGWVAHVGHAGREFQGIGNSYAAAAASSLACAELFRRIFLKSTDEKDTSVSLLDFSNDAGQCTNLMPGNLGDVIFVGVGAVGNAAIWALSRDQGIAGKLRLVDPEDLTLLNLQRYVLGTYADVSQSKVELAKRVLEQTNLVVETYRMTIEQFADGHHGIDIPTICISVDNVESRRVAQALLPKIIVNGWTGEQALGVSSHLFSREAACLACLYQPQGQGVSATEQAAQAFGLSVERAALLWVTRQPISDEDLQTAAKTLGVEEETLSPWRGKPLGELYTNVLCGAVPLDISGVGRIETVPLAHQSALAGILLAAELVKRTRPELSSLAQSEPLISWDDVLRPPPSIWAKPRPREVGCICGDADYQEVYKKKWPAEVEPHTSI